MTCPSRATRDGVGLDQAQQENCSPTSNTPPRKIAGDKCACLVLQHPILRGNYSRNGLKVRKLDDHGPRTTSGKGSNGGHTAQHCQPRLCSNLWQTAEAIEEVNAGQSRIAKWDSIKDNPPPQLKISPIAAIPHKSMGFCSIPDLLVWCKPMWATM